MAVVVLVVLVVFELVLVFVMDGRGDVVVDVSCVCCLI
jgi:hypothetical protein